MAIRIIFFIIALGVAFSAGPWIASLVLALLSSVFHHSWWLVGIVFILVGIAIGNFRFFAYIKKMYISWAIAFGTFLLLLFAFAVSRPVKITHSPTQTPWRDWNAPVRSEPTASSTPKVIPTQTILPQNSECPTWTTIRNDVYGTRYDVWSLLYGQSRKITWEEFKDKSVKCNPVLKKDGYIFIKGKKYYFP